MTSTSQGSDQFEAPFHEGEVMIQRQLGVDDRMAIIGRSFIRSEMPEQHRDFFSQLPFMVLGTQDASGQPWATMLAGAPGFVQSPDPTHLTMSTHLPASDPALAAISNGAPIGGLGIELATRRRNRFTAHVESHTKSTLALKIDQSFGNCPQFIQTREIIETRDPATPHPETPQRIDRLEGPVLDLVRRADTFFVASSTEKRDPSAPNSGVDVSHRGGASGFVKVDNDRTLTIPDFAGNRFFNTLGNLLLHPKAGLLFPDFDTGALVHLAGTVEIIWGGKAVDQFPGAERAWRFTLDHGLVRPEGLPMRFDFGEFSPKSVQLGAWTGPVDR